MNTKTLTQNLFAFRLRIGSGHWRNEPGAGPRRNRFAPWIALGLLLAAEGEAVQPPAQKPLDNFDKRQSTDAPERALPAAQTAALNELHGRLPKAKVEFDLITGSPKFVSAADGFLSGPNGEGKGTSRASAEAFAANDPHRATKAFLKEHSKLFGHGPEALAQARVKRDFTTAHNGLRTVVWEQQVDNLPVFEAVLTSHTTSRGELVNISSQFVGDVERAANRAAPGRGGIRAAPGISARHAVALAAGNLGETASAEAVTESDEAAEGAEQRQKFKAPFLRGESEAKLIWLPMDREALRLCWDVILTARLRGEMYRMLVDAQTGEILLRRCLTEYISNASYRIYTSDSPSPFSPAHPTPLTNQPPLLTRTLVTLPALNTNASPNGWIDDGVNETRGNNVDAHTDRNDDNVPDLPRPTGSPFRVFDFPMDLMIQDPLAYSNASVAQLFYVCNWMHDKLYELGFTEAAGNFQNNNFGRGGFANDALQADALDGGGTDNANMATPPDGSPPRMQMYIFDGPIPRRDGDFDVEIVLHEYTHGLSNRRVGGGVGLSALQSRGMGEGWSDFYAIALLGESGDDVDGVYAKGGYATFLLSPAYLQNYYFGIRRYPYCTDLLKNPLTFKDIDPGQASTHPGVPRSPLFSGGSANEVHNQGEVWCVTLWEARANLIHKYGFALGNQLILQLVTDGMNLSPANPNFLQARDGILQADLVNNGGANRNELWAAFAKRGMGLNATSPNSSTTTGVFESYEIPDDLFIRPNSGFVAIGPVGGPFSPSFLTYTLTNSGAAALTWAAGTTSAWLSVSLTGGTLVPGGASAEVTVSLNSVADSLPMGVYSATVRFTNLTSGAVVGRQVLLRAGQLDYFTELFSEGDNDLAFKSFTFTPNGSPAFYSVCREVATNFPAGTNTATSIVLGNHSTRVMTVSNSATVSLYGRATNVFFLSSDGHITFNTADSSGTATLANHFNLPRISALFSHMHPSDGGGLVLYQQLSNRVAVTFARVVDVDVGRTNSFQMELFFDGRIRLTYLTVGSTAGLVGLSRGTGLPFDFLESDFSSYSDCTLPLRLTAPASANEGDGVLAGAGRVFLPSALSSNLTVSLISSDTTEVTVPSNVVVSAGQTNAAFNVTIADDADLDGTQTATITATAPGFAGANRIVTVHDNEVATLSMVLAATVTEGGGSTQGVVRVNAPVMANVVVSLSSSDPSEIQVPASVVIPSGQTSAVFAVTIVDDVLIDGPQNATVIAQVQNWIAGSQIVTVLDNENLDLTVTLPAYLTEGNGTLANAGEVRLSGLLSSNLPVDLVSSDTSELIVEPSIIIPAGQLSAAFGVIVVNDAIVDGNQLVTVTATGPGFNPGATNVVIVDDESPPLPFNPNPPDLASNLAPSIALSWSGCGPGISNEVYFGTSPSLGPADYLGTTTNCSWSLPLLAPLTTYYWRIAARKAGTTLGPVWRFTTRGVDHFDFSQVASPQVINQPFSVTITAKDELDRIVTNFAGPVQLSGSSQMGLSGDNFDRPNSSSLGANWTLQVGAWRIESNQARSSPNSSSELVTFNNAATQGVATVDVVYIGPPRIMYSALVPRYSDLGNNIFVKVQDNDQSGHFNMVYFYYGNNGGPWGGMTGGSYNVSVVPFTQARLTARWVDDTITLEIDRDFDSIPEDTLTRGGIPLSNLGSGLGLGGYSDAAFDNFASSGGIGGGIAVSPTVSGNFTEGRWTGDMAVLEPATNMFLVADDQRGHTGRGNPFTVLLRNDIALTMQASSNQVDVGGNLTYTLRVENSGPLLATGVTLSNVLPTAVSFLSVASSQGSCTNLGGTIVCSLGTIAGTSNAVVTLLVRPLAAGPLTNSANVVRAEADTYAGNNVARVVTTVRPPSLSISDVALEEGDGGVTNAVFELSLSTPSSQTVSVSFATVSGSALAGSDFIGTNGIVTFTPGATNGQLIVGVIGDLVLEPQEFFFVNLSLPVNAVLAESQGQGTIINDDNIPGKLHHFIWSAVPSPQVLDVPFPVTLTAQDAFNGTVTNFTGTVALSAGGQVSTNTILASPFHTQAGSGSFTLGYAFTPRTNITVTHVRHYFGTKVSIWTDGGVLLLSQNVSSTPGTWKDTPVATPLQLTGGTRYRIGAFTAGSTYYWDYGLGASFPDGTIDQSYEGGGDTFPTTIDSVDWWFVDLRYTAGNPNSAPITPTVSGPFVNGLWTGQVAVLSIATNLALFASDGANHTGASNPFHVVRSNQPPVILAQPANQVSPLGGTASFSVSALGTPPLAYQWQSNGVNLLNATNTSLVLAAVTTNHAGVYRVIVSNAWGTVTSSNATLLVSDITFVAVFDNPIYVDTGNSSSSESDNVQASLVTLNFNVTTFTNIIAAAATNSILLFPDLEVRALGPDLTPAMISSLANFVAGGGLMIVHGTGFRSGELINTVFGLSVIESSQSAGGPSYALTGEAAGTAFADDPVAVPFHNGCSTLTKSSLPPGSLSIYELSGQTMVAIIPRGSGKIIFLGFDWYNAAPVGTQDGGWLTVLESAVSERLPPSLQPIIRQQPTSRTVYESSTVSMSVLATGVQPLRYQWHKNGTAIPSATNAVYTLVNVQTNDAGSYHVVVTNFYGMAASSNAVLTVFTLPPSAEFQVVALRTNNSRIVDHNSLTGDDRGAIAVSSSMVLYSGDIATARFALSDLSGGAGLGRIFDGMVSDLRTGTIYSLGNGSTPVGPSGGTVTTLLEHDGSSGLLNGASIVLSSPIVLPSSGLGIFAGYGRVVLHTGTRVYDISLPSGFVADLGSMAAPVHQFTENQAYWGVAEYFGGSIYLIYVRDPQTISRTAVPGGATATLASFSNLSDMACLTVSIPFGRWYFHYESSGQFGGSLETLGYADALFLVTGETNPPTIFTQPANQVAAQGGSATFSVSALGTPPLRYQWRKNGASIPLATNNSYTINPVQSSDAAGYSVVVSNIYGAVTSVVATLTVLDTGGIVAYYTDDSPFASGPEGPIIAAGLIPLRVTNIATYILANAGILFIDEPNNNGVSPALQSRLPEIRTWVAGGGKLIVHDRSAGNLNPNPFLLGTTGAVSIRLETSDLDVIPPGNTLVTAGPFGTINNAILDGGSSSAHGYNAYNQLPFTRTAILSIGSDTNRVAAFSYSLGQGLVYYSSIPLDCYLSGGGCSGSPIGPPLENIYTPNVLVYVASYRSCSNCPPTISSQPTGLSVQAGTNVTFSVSASGTALLGYQWRKDGVNLTNGGRISGVNGIILSIANVVESDSGQYSVLVTNAFGSTNSANALLLVSSLDHFGWSPIPSPQFAHTPFPVTIRALDASNRVVTNFSGSVSLSALIGQQTATNILGAPPHTDTLSGNYTLGYAFTPNRNLTVTHVRRYFGSKISIWTDGGLLLAAQNVSGTPGTWTETPLTTPIQLTAGVRYRVAAYTGGSNYFWRTTFPVTFPDGTIDQSYQGSGDTFPTGTDSVRWLVDLRYTIGTTVTVPVIPSVSSNFVQGTWTGRLRAPQVATNLTLRADDGQGHFGLSGAINVLNEPEIELERSGDILLIVWPASTPGFIVEYSETLSPPLWLPLSDPPIRVGEQWVLPIFMEETSGFYRLTRP